MLDAIGTHDGHRRELDVPSQWRVRAGSLEDLRSAMDQASAMDDGAIPRDMLAQPAVYATPEQIERSLERLAADPPDDVPDEWAEWLS